MTVLALVTTPGSGGCTTAAVLLAALMPSEQSVLVAECDPSGGDVSGWASMPPSPGWASLIASGEQGWSAVEQHIRHLPGGPAVLVAPSRATEARVVVEAAAERFGPLFASMPELLVIADCGRMVTEVPAWALQAEQTVIVIRQGSGSPGATIGRVDHAVDATRRLRAAGIEPGLFVIGSRPYPAEQLASVMQVPLWGAVADDASGAGLVAGGWTLGRGVTRSALARSIRPVAASVAGRLQRVPEAIGVGT